MSYTEKRQNKQIGHVESSEFIDHLRFGMVMLTSPNPKTNFINFTESVDFTLYMKNGVITHVKRAL